MNHSETIFSQKKVKILPMTVLSLALSSVSCADQKEPSSILSEKELTGKELAQSYCSTCHLLPNPSDAPKEFWPVIVQWMGAYLGMKGDELEGIEPGPPAPAEIDTADDYTISFVMMEKEGLLGEKRYFNIKRYYSDYAPSERVISQSEFQRIADYFVENAHPAAEMIKPIPNHPLLKRFKPKVPELELEPNGLVLSFAVDEEGKRLYIGRAVTDDWVGTGRPGFEDYDDLVVLDLDSGKRLGDMRLASDPNSLELTETGVRVAIHGEMPLIKGAGEGKVLDIDGLDTPSLSMRTLVEGVHRVVLHHTEDFNGDGLEDILTHGFGDGMFQDYGGFGSVYWQTPESAQVCHGKPVELVSNDDKCSKTFRKTQLIDHVGMVGSAVGDLNQDGRPDIVLLMAQANQQVLAFINNGDETFTKHVVAKYTPSHGGNTVEIADYDNDGLMDIAAINGDHPGGNHVGPGRPHPRAHHGLRIYKNMGDLAFKEHRIYNMHGAIRSVAEDFDNDGDLDIAMISLYPDWSWDLPETFVYLENKGKLEFTPRSLSKDNFGIWATIEKGDVNGDGKKDIILGSGSNFFPLVPGSWVKHKIMDGRDQQAPTVIYLLNEH